MHTLSPIFTLLIVVINLGLAPLARAESQKPKPLLALDNYGGYAHPGRRITIFADNGYELVKYTDVIGNEKVRRGKSSVDLQAGTLHLDSDKKDGEKLFRVRYEEKEYWVHKDQVDRIKQADERMLRQNSLRNKR